MSPLEEDYRNDDYWYDFVNYYRDNYLDENARKIALKINNNLDMAVVINGKRGLKEGLWWIEQRVPALENKRPIDCLEEPNLIKRLRVCLMRMR